ncbi:13416_t:CDS:2, partial [Racocetra fulgida]
WHPYILTNNIGCQGNINSNTEDCYVTIMQYYAYCLQLRHYTLNNDNTVNEIHQYIDARYVLAHESIWPPDVIHLVVHLPGQHLVTFTDNKSLVNVARRAQNQKSTLTA